MDYIMGGCQISFTVKAPGKASGDGDISKREGLSS